ncbi:urease accessory protein UreF [Aliishimia ponticola]|uniref:Urease accessory protein UreF n=1 Tax=Aliishimia ponticola TaxID=2499833 RepID=A0A4V3XK80_9RHOB|nr:urease accessory UreF family protein [Aliishimia ponticola]THH35933.1 urease accessory protein UreF [Aliishimia ponticola]
MTPGTDPALVLAQWFSPGFPIGAFAYSHGLEWLIESGDLATAQDLQDWIEVLLRDGTGKNDAIFVASAYDAETEDQMQMLDDLCRAYCSGLGRRVETVEQGGAFARTLRDMGAAEVPDMCYPVAVGRAARLAGLPLGLTIRFYLHAFAANLISAAVRRVPLGQVEGQRVLAALAPVIEGLSRAVPDLDLPDLGTTSFAAEIAGMAHETLYSKTFRT